MRVVLLYEALGRLAPSPVVCLSRAGITTSVRLNRRHLAALKAEEHVLAVHALHWAE